VRYRQQSPFLRSVRQRGFSLLELLVVIVIIGIVVAIVSINFSPGDSRLDETARRLEALIGIASDESMMAGQEMGITFYQSGYEFAVLSPDINLQEYEWIRLTDDDMFKARPLPAGLVMELFVEDQAIVLTDEQDETEAYEPQIYILSSGEVTPFDVRFRPEFDSDGILLTIGADGTTEITMDANR